jgi:hypothetical protein
MAMTFDDVDAVARKLPGVTVGTKWGNRTWMVDGKGFAWQRPFSKADLKRFGEETPPAGEILAVSVENLDAKDALLAMAPPGFFTIAHFNGYPAVLIALRQARAKDVRAAILDAFRAVAASLPIAKRAAPRAGKRRGDSGEVTSATARPTRRAASRPVTSARATATSSTSCPRPTWHSARAGRSR